MRINIVMGFFLPVPPAAGGATEKSWFGLAREFAARGHEVTLLSRRWPDWSDDEVREGVHYLRLRGHDHTSSLWLNLWFDAWWSLRASRHLPAADITIVTCIALPLWLGRRRRAGSVVVMCGRMPKGQFRWYAPVSRILAVSAAVRDAVLTENAALAPVLRVTGYPIRYRELALPRPERPADAPLVIGYIGRIHEEKGLELLAEGLVRLAQRSGLPRWRAVLVGPQAVAEGGSGPAFVARLRDRLGGLPEGSWELRPPVYSEPELGECYRAVDLFCYPSLAERGETFGVAVAEAMAAGAVPVVSRLHCFADFVTDDESGVILDAAETDAAERLAEILAALLLDPARRARLAGGAQAAVARYDFSAYAEARLRDFSTLPTGVSS